MIEHFMELSLVSTGYENPQWWRFFGRLHPLLLHFPLAMLIAAGFVELVMSWRKQARPHLIATFCLFVGTIFTILATWTGWEMADHEDIAANPVKAELLEWHRWTGVALAILTILICLTWLFERFSAKRWAFNAYRYGLWSSAVLVCFVGHFGAEMKWGRDYLFSVLRTQVVEVSQTAPPAITTTPESPSPAPSPVEEIVKSVPTVSWSGQIEPVLESRCGDCHGPDAQKGGLQLVPYEAFREHLYLVDKSSPMQSILVHRIVLPKTDPDAMPPNGQRLTKEQIQQITDWIGQGTPGPVGQIQQDSRESNEERTPPETSASEDLRSPVFDSSRALEARSSIETLGGFVAPLSRNSPWLDVNLSLIRPSVDDSQIAVLEDLKEALVWLNLGDTQVTDQGLEQTVSRLKSLRRLRLDRTRITSRGVRSLTTLQDLEVLNLFGTPVGDECLAAIGQLPSLQSVYLWDTQVTKAGLDGLRSLRPTLDVVVGMGASGEELGRAGDDRSRHLPGGS